MEKLDERRIEAGSLIMFGGVLVLLPDDIRVLCHRADKDAIDEAMRGKWRSVNDPRPDLRACDSWIGI